MPDSPPFARLHASIGWITLVVFLATGQYMRTFHQPPVEELEPGLRMLFRSRHIYLLFAALLNLLAAGRAGAGRPRWLAVAGSSLLILSPVLLVTAFVVEPAGLGVPTAIGIYGVQAAFAGTLGLAIAAARGSRRG